LVIQNGNAATFNISHFKIASPNFYFYVLVMVQFSILVVRNVIPYFVC